MSNTTIKQSFRKRANQRKNRRGATAVEFALVFPIIMTFFIGIIGINQAFLIRDFVQLAAYEAAREGTIQGANSDDVEDKADEVLAMMNLQGYTVDVTDFDDSSETINVSISVPFSDNAWVGGPFFPHSINLGSNVELRRRFDQGDE